MITLKNNKVFQIVLKQKATIVALAISYLLNSVATLFLPYLMSEMVECIKTFDEQQIYLYAVYMGIAALVILACSFFNQKTSSRLSTKVVAELQKEIFNKVNSLTFDEFADMGTSSLITRTTEDASLIREVAGEIVYAFIAVPTMFIGGVFMSFLSDWVLALIVLAFCPLVLFITRLITKNIWQIWDESDKLTDEQNRIVRERLSGVRVVRAFNRDLYEHKRAETATLKMNWNYFKGNSRGGLVSPMAMLLLNLATVLIIYVAHIRATVSMTFEAEKVIAIVQYIAFIVNAVIMLSWTMVFLPHVKVAVNRMEEVLQLEGCEDEIHTGEKLNGTIDIKNLCFRYAGASRDALSNINLEAKEGEIVAIIGGTGCGKSAITKMLMYFYQPQSGEIFLGGRSYAELGATSVRDNISVALQNTMIFEGTVKENIKMGNDSATDEQMRQIAKIAQIDDFIMSQDDGYDYGLKQSGTNLSGGQKQRISIARTLLKEAAVYVFDDSFSALDFLTEKNLRTALNKYLKGKTQIIITQRVSTAMRCDKVYVMDKGEIIGCGKHEELLKDCTVYREIADSQLKGGVAL